MKILFPVIVLLTVSKGLAYQSSFIRDCLEAHNAVRARHGVPALNWSAEIAVSAQKWANHLAAIDQLQHDSSTPLGENLFYMYGGDPSRACDRAVQNWYQEVKNYDFKSAHLDDSTSHFSQLIWRDSKNVGIGSAQSKSGNFFLVARYNPRGNVDGQLNDNVPDVTPHVADENNVENKGGNEANVPTAQDQPSNSQSSKGQNFVYFKEIRVDPNAVAPESNITNMAVPQEQFNVELGPSEGPEQSDQRHGTSYVGAESHELERIRPPYVKMEMNEIKQRPEYAKEVYSLPIVRPSNEGTEETVANERPNFPVSDESETKVMPNNGGFEMKETKARPSYEDFDQTETKVRPNYAGSDQIETKTRPNYAGSDQIETKARPNYAGSDQIEMKVRPNYAGSDQIEMKVRPNYAGSDQIETKTRPNYAGLEPNEMKARPDNAGSDLDEMKAKAAPNYEKQAEKESEAVLENFAKLQMNDEAPKQGKEQFGLTYVPPEVIEPKPKPSFSSSPPENKKGPGPHLLKQPLNDARAGLGPPAIAIITPKRGKDFRVEIRFKSLVFTHQMVIPGSKDFEEVKRNITQAVINLFDEDDDFQEVQLISLRNGSTSVIAMLGLLFKKDAPGHLDRMTKALQAGKIGDWTVASAYESAVALPAGYLKPSRPQQRPGVGVCAQPCSRPNHCYSAGCLPFCCAFHPRKLPGPPLPQALSTCPGACDDTCFPDCDNDCCSDMTEPALAPAPMPLSTSPGIMCPGSCHFSCYPQCTQQCCDRQLVPNPCHVSCPAYCAPSCDNACCATRKSLVNSLSREYSRYRSVQRAMARQLYLRRHLKPAVTSMKRVKPVTPVRPVRPRQMSRYKGHSRLDDWGLEEYDRSGIYPTKRGDITKHHKP